MAITIENRFLKLKDDFKKDTGLDFDKENMALYIQYVNVRFNDVTNQVVQGLTNQLLNKVDFLPNQIRLQMAEMLTDHPTIKQLLKSKS